MRNSLHLGDFDWLRSGLAVRAAHPPRRALSAAMPRPFQLRDYQRDCIEEIERRNVIVVLPTNSGKTVIAAEAIRLTLQREEVRKVVFLAPYAALARQQAALLLRHIEPLHLKEDERAAADRQAARWRLGLVVGGMPDGGDEAGLLPWSRAFEEAQCLVMTSEMLVRSLMHACVKMSDIALLIFDEVHRHKGDDLYTTVTKYFYAHPRLELERRPRILGLTASPIDEPDGPEPSEEMVEEKLRGLETSLNAQSWSRQVTIGHLTNSVQRYDEMPADEMRTTAQLVEELLDGCQPEESRAEEAGFPELFKGWALGKDKVRVVATELGLRPCLSAVGLLAKSLRRAATHSCPANAKPWFVAKEDETDSMTAPSSANKQALRSLLTEVADRLTENVQKVKQRLGDAACGHSRKAQALLDFLQERAGAGVARKCLIFVPQRIVCKLLAELLEERLPGWSVAFVVATGKVGFASGLGAEQFSLQDQADAIGRFKKDLRVLVATSIVEEGMDVPDCDLVVNFDPPHTSREQQQRGGRARAPMATFATLISSGHAYRKVLEGQERLNKWNLLVSEVLNKRGAERPPPESMVPPPEANFLETTEGALLPLTRAKDFLHSKVYSLRQLRRDGSESKLPLTGDGERFGDKGNFDVVNIDSGRGFVCTLTLPDVILCSANTAEKLPHTLPPSRPERNAKDAQERAALDGCRYLHGIGVLDDYLRVVGREEKLRELRERKTPRRGTRRDNAYHLGTPEPAVRRLPHCLLPPADGVLRELWAHPIELDRSPTQLALLLPAKLPEQLLAEPFMLGAADSTHAQRQQCRLGQPFQLKLDAAQLKQLVRFHVATFDLVRPRELGIAGNEGELLHPLLDAPRQLITFNRFKGTYSPYSAEGRSGAAEPGVPDDAEQPRCEMPAWADAALAAANSAAEEWHRVASGSACADALARLLRPLVSSSSSVVAVFDLDHTLWAGRCDEWPVGSFERFVPPAGSVELRHRQVRDKLPRPADGATSRRVLELHVEVPLIFDALRRAGARIAIASASAAADSARELLAKFELSPEEMLIEMASPESRTGVTEAKNRVGFVLLDDRLETRQPTEGGGAEPLKARQLRSLAEQMGVAVERLVLFDDQQANVNAVRHEAVGAGALLLDQGQGLTVDALLRGLTFHAKELERRRTSGLDDSGFTTKENELLAQENGHEKRRKAKLSRLGGEGSRFALIDSAPAEARLAKRRSDPGLWLLAPLTNDMACVDLSHAQLVSDTVRDCRLNDAGEMLFPSLNDRAHELLRRRAEVSGGGVRYEMAGLATWRRRHDLEQHFNLVANVKDSAGDDDYHNEDSISCDQFKRSVLVGARAQLRSLHADGKHRTSDTLHEGPSNDQGRRRDEMQLVPVLNRHLEPLRVLRRVVWRVEHLALMAELDGLQQTMPTPDGAATSWLPAGAVAPQLSLLVSAMTHKMAQAESLQRETADATRADERGCCNYEVAEFLGDAVLDLLAKLSMMASKANAAESENVLNPQAEQILGNRNLYERASKLGLSELGLFTPFQDKQRLPNLRKALISRKMQADVVEALLGVVCLAQLEADPHGPGRLGHGLDAAKAFFDKFIHPQLDAQPPGSAEWMGAARQLQESMGTWKRSAEAPGQSNAELIEKALLLPTGRQFTRRRDLLLECCSWNKNTPFQRLEFLGDAFLQYVISCELRERYPQQEEGFLTSLRSVLVQNLHLGRLLTRRLGADVAGRLFGRETDQHRKIQDFILSVPGKDDEVLDAVWAYDAKRRSEEKEMDDDATTITTSKRGDDPCKPTGDVYEALMGLVLIEFEGDVDEAWRVFKEDFFPHPRSDDEEAELTSAYEEERRRALRREVGSEYKRREERLVQGVAKAVKAANSRQAERAQTQTAEMAPAAEADAPAVLEPVQVFEEQAPEPVGPAHDTTVEAAAPPQAASAPPKEQPPAADEVALAAPAAASLPTPLNPRGQVEAQLRQVQLEPSDVFEVEDGPPELKEFACIVRSKRTQAVLGQVEGCVKKRQASHDAWLKVLSHPGLSQLIDEEVGLRPQQPPTPPSPSAATAEQPRPPSGAVALPPPPPPSVPPTRHESTGPLVYTYAMKQATSETLAPLFEILREMNQPYRNKITKHVQRCGLDDASLTELASNKRKESETSNHSAGRLFHDTIASLANGTQP